MNGARSYKSGGTVPIAAARNASSKDASREASSISIFSLKLARRVLVIARVVTGQSGFTEG